jgi:hypothetical protein
VTAFNTRYLTRYAVVGAVAFAAAQSSLFLLTGSDGRPTIDSAGWFLNSGRGVLVIAVVLALTSATLAATGLPPNVWRGLAAFAGGASVMIAVAVLALGPGTIYPIVIAVGVGVAAVATAIGVGVGILLRRRPMPRP